MPGTVTGRARYRKILRFAAWHLAVTWWFEILLPTLRLERVSARHRTDRLTRFARRFHTLALELGGLMIKVGQYMSSRLDVLPPEFTKELEGLQDEVPPVPFSEIRALAQAELGVRLEAVFASIDEVPVAAASLGQVHRAILSDADAATAGFAEAVVKVQRPGIEDVVLTDLEALRRIAQWVGKFRAVSKRVDARALVEQFGRTSLEEVDYLHEAASAARFAENFADDPRVEAPQIAWERTTRRVITMQDVTAIKGNDVEALVAAGIAPSDVADVFAEVMFEQLFEHGFFHADPHPGNLFITPLPDAGEGPAWTLTFVDFGMMGEIPATLRSDLRGLIIAAAGRDGKRMVVALQSAGVLLAEADTKELELVMTELFARFGGMGFAQLRDVDPNEFRDFAGEFGDVLYDMPFQLPDHFLLIGRAMSLTSGLASSLHPDYNLWDSVEPFAAKLLRDEGQGIIADFAKQAVDNLALLWRLPARIDAVVAKAEDGTLSVSAPVVERELVRLERAATRVVFSVLFAGLLIGGALVRDHVGWLGNILMISSALALARALWSGRRR